MTRRVPLSIGRVLIDRPSARSAGKTRADAGFTLVEVMVALAVFGILAAAGVTLLSFSVRAQGATQAKLDDIGAIERLTAALGADFGQALPRHGRNAAGDPVPAFEGNVGGTDPALVTLIRGGWSNLDDAPRPSVQRVAYRLADGAIERVAYPMPDGAAPFVTAPLLTRVAGVTLRYRYNGAWSDRWAGDAPAPLPQVAEVTIVRTDGTTYRRLFVVGTGYVP